MKQTEGESKSNTTRETYTVWQMNCETCAHASTLSLEEGKLYMRDHPSCEWCTVLMGSGHVEEEVNVRCSTHLTDPGRRKYMRKYRQEALEAKLAANKEETERELTAGLT